MIEEINNLLDAGKFQKGLQLLDKGLVSDQYNIELLQLKGKVLRHLKDYPASIEIYSGLINLLPNDADIYAERGLSFHSAEQKTAAIADFSKAIELEPENGYRYASRAFIKNYYGDHAEALEDYNKAIELDPKDAISLNNKGMIEENLGREKDAIKSFMEADQESGVDQKIDQIRSLAPKKRPVVSIKENTSSWTHFIDTLKALFNSKEERRSFFKFIGKK